MADGRHFENGFIATSQPKIIRFKWNLACRCRLWFRGRQLNKIPKIQIQNGGRPPYSKSSFDYISTSDYRINAKFCRIKQNHVLTQDKWPKCQISKVQDGGRPPFKKNGFIAKTQPEIIRFQRNLVCSRKLRFQGRSHYKVPQFCKFNMADGRHDENRVSVISGRLIVWLTRNFVQRSIITLRHRLRDQNIRAVDIWTAIINQQI